MAAKLPYILAVEKHDPGLFEKAGCSRRSLKRAARSFLAMPLWALSEGTLAKRIKTLMPMLINAIIKHESGVERLSRIARAAGASEEEMKETVHAAYVSGGLQGAGDRRHYQRGIAGMLELACRVGRLS